VWHWLGQVNGGFLANDSNASQPLSTTLQIAGVGDFNGDGKADLLLRASDGSLQTWTGSDSGAILSPMEKLWADSVQAARDLMNEMTVRTIQADITAAQIAAHSGGAPTPPTWSMAGQLSAAIGDAWYLATMPDSPSSTTNIFNVIVGGSDPTFQLLSADDTSVSLSFGDDFDSMTLIDSVANTFSIAIDGISLIADWISGLPSGPVVNPGDIVVTGVRPTGSTVSPDPALYQPSGYFTFDALASGFNFSDGFGGAAPVLSSRGEPVEPYLHSSAAHMAPFAARHLTPGEIAALAGLTPLTPEQLAQVWIREGGTTSGVAAWTWEPYLIRMSTPYALVDYSGSPETMGLLVHELYHSYQWIFGDSTARFLYDEFVDSRFHDIYAYNQNDLNNFANLNVETQASIQEDAYRWSHGLTTLNSVGTIDYTQLVNLLGTQLPTGP
jgi:hypothetical protein